MCVCGHLYVCVHGGEAGTQRPSETRCADLVCENDSAGASEYPWHHARVASLECLVPLKSDGEVPVRGIKINHARYGRIYLIMVMRKAALCCHAGRKELSHEPSGLKMSCSVYSSRKR